MLIKSIRGSSNNNFDPSIPTIAHLYHMWQPLKCCTVHKCNKVFFAIAIFIFFTGGSLRSYFMDTQSCRVANIHTIVQPLTDINILVQSDKVSDICTYVHNCTILYAHTFSCRYDNCTASPAKFLEVLDQYDFSEFCLGFMFTYRYTATCSSTVTGWYSPIL